MKYFKNATDEGHGKLMGKYSVKLLKYLESLPKEVNKDGAMRLIKKVSDKGLINLKHE